MSFVDAGWESILPPYLREGAGKSRLKEALAQFRPEHRGGRISYDDFYASHNPPNFLQTDIIYEIRTSIWNRATAQYDKGYGDAIIISNSCDISSENQRGANPKQCLFAPLVDLSDYSAALIANGHSEIKVQQFLTEIRSQLVSNLFYLPPRPGRNIEHLVRLDRIFWFPLEELMALLPSIEEERIISLNQFGFYLFALKLSYHLCRLPEEVEGRI